MVTGTEILVTMYFLKKGKHMEVIIIEEHGFESAMLGLSLNKKQPVENMPNVAFKLCDKDGGHNKFLESIFVWMDVKAPRYWWQEFDTYRVGISKQSESTVYTILKDKLVEDDFEGGMDENTLSKLNNLRDKKDLMGIKRNLPESFLQRRIVCVNYRTLRNMLSQRKNHKVKEWHTFFDSLLNQLEYPEYIRKEKRNATGKST